jgi:transposase
MNGAKFLAYVKQCLAPTLKRKDMVVIDNLPAHKAAGIREAIEARDASLSAPILARPESHRDAVQQAEGISAQGGGTNNSSPAPPNRQVRLP